MHGSRSHPEEAVGHSRRSEQAQDMGGLCRQTFFTYMHMWCTRDNAPPFDARKIYISRYSVNQNPKAKSDKDTSPPIFPIYPLYCKSPSMSFRTRPAAVLLMIFIVLIRHLHFPAPLMSSPLKCPLLNYLTDTQPNRVMIRQIRCFRRAPLASSDI